MGIIDRLAMKIDLHCHGKLQVGCAYTEFKNSVTSMAELVREIKNGR